MINGEFMFATDTISFSTDSQLGKMKLNRHTKTENRSFSFRCPTLKQWHKIQQPNQLIKILLHFGILLHITAFWYKFRKDHL